ncbi:MAG: DUF134 domain-containing protein [Bacteroidales bacterium]|nr:DUF134 domain-containing protein [Bacteroidales bacterium]
MPPRAKGFMPMGYYAREQDPVFLNLEEFESIRLLDYEGLSQTGAATIMEVSRPTITRIYQRARKKIATALTESRQVLIEGGHAIYNGNWFECTTCLCHFNVHGQLETMSCPLCGNTSVLKNSNYTMIAAIPVQKLSTESKISVHFARSNYFAIVNSIEGSIQLVQNPFLEETMQLGNKVMLWLDETFKTDTLIAFELGLKVHQIANHKGWQQIILGQNINNLKDIQLFMKGIGFNAQTEHT